MSRIEVVLEALHVKIERRRGRRGWALCPYHQDVNNPSEQPTAFFVRLTGERAGQVHCFSCKRGGSLVDLVMFMRSCDFAAAKLFVESKGKGYEPPLARARVRERPAMIGRFVFKLPPEIYFGEPLAKWVSGARKYAMGRCQITADDVERFGLGYAVEGILAGRIVLPWKNVRGVVGGYSARTFINEEPKYKTPHESENPDPVIMFGEHTWSIKREVLVVTEGALNALAVRRALPEFEFDIVGMGGSDTKSENFPSKALKFSSFKKIVTLTDSDPAGDKAAIAIASSIGRHSEIVRPRFPDKKDALDVGRDHIRSVFIPLFEKLGVTRVSSDVIMALG